MNKTVEKLRTFFKITNAAFDFMQAIQSATNTPIFANKMHQLHKLALIEIEKDAPNLAFIDALLAEMEGLAEINNTLKPRFPSGEIPVGE